MPIEELAKLTIFVNRFPGQRQESVEFTLDITDVNIIQWEVHNLARGQHWFYMSATDIDGEESGFSNELSKIC